MFGVIALDSDHLRAGWWWWWWCPDWGVEAAWGPFPSQPIRVMTMPPFVKAQKRWGTAPRWLWPSIWCCHTHITNPRLTENLLPLDIQPEALVCLDSTVILVRRLSLFLKLNIYTFSLGILFHWGWLEHISVWFYPEEASVCCFIVQVADIKTSPLDLHVFCLYFYVCWSFPNLSL